MKTRSQTLVESLGEDAGSFTVKKPNRRNVKSWKLKRKMCNHNQLKEAA